MTWVTSNRFANSWIQGGFSRVGFSPWETSSHLCSCKTLILQRAHPPLRPKCLFQAQELTRCFPEKDKSGAPIFAVSFMTKPCHPVKEQDRALWQKGYDFQPWVWRLKYYYLRYRLSILFLCLQYQQFFQRNTSDQPRKVKGSLRWPPVHMSHGIILAVHPYLD